MTFYNRAWQLMMPLLLSACAVGPDYVPPTQSAADHYTAPQETRESASNIALGKPMDAEWWTIFSSVALNNLIQHAVGDNYDLKAARETLSQAEAAVDAQQGSLMPQMSLNALAGRQKYGVALFGPSNFVIPPFTYYEVGPSLSWTPDIFGGGKHQIERQQALAAYQKHELDALYVELTGNVVSQAIQLAAVKSELVTVQGLVESDEKNLDMIQSAVLVGAATQSDILNAQASLAQDRQLIPPLKQQSSLNLHMLSVLLGKAPADWSLTTLRFEELTLPPLLPVALPTTLVHGRPDILAAESGLQAASASLGVAMANQYPALTLTANMLQEALTPSNLFLGAGNAWALLGGISMPLFDGGTLAAEKQEAIHGYQASLAEYRQTVVHAFSQVADALTALANDEDTLKITTLMLQIAQSSLDLTRQSQNAGNSSRLEVETAHRSLIQAQFKCEEAQLQRYLDVVRLFVALGGSPLVANTSQHSKL
ncbi:MAG: efflux transporter outer membrane subunit [Ferrovum sp.]|nr:efflux transporter outer membrane subunit [Ferrovum sp.]NDU87792.1 efflux transporter outer membrane subunit [Ferrovum sp.]